MSELALFSDDVMLRHNAGGDHPEQPARLAAILACLREHDLEVRPPDAFDPAAVLRVHPQRHLDGILALEGRAARIDPDTATSPESLDAIRAAVGCSLAAVRSAMDGTPAFAMVRPPGHHAEPERAMGFCFFNNIAIAAEEALALGAERVLIVDWDVHHGNGTQAAFWERGDVFFFSTHQWPLYPGTGAAGEVGEGDGYGTTQNVPMPRGCGDADFARVFDELLRPTAALFQPDVVLVSAGFDAHEDDPLAAQCVTTEGFGKLASTIAEIADEHAGGRLALFLEGGYDLGALTASVYECINHLTD